MLKTQNGCFTSKVGSKLFCVKTVSAKVVGHSLPNYSCKNYWWGDPFYLKFWIKLTALERSRRFSIYFRPYIAPQL